MYRSEGNGSDPRIAADNVDQLLAIDPSPDQTHPSYYVTAIDNAGNESPPSDPVYQKHRAPSRADAGDQPGRRLESSRELVRIGDIAGYDIYQGPEGQQTKLNTQGLLTVTSFDDNGYSPAADRIYTVVTVDTNLMESLGRSLPTPLGTKPVLSSRFQSDRTRVRWGEFSIIV